MCCRIANFKDILDLFCLQKADTHMYAWLKLRLCYRAAKFGNNLLDAYVVMYVCTVPNGFKEIVYQFWAAKLGENWMDVYVWTVPNGFKEIVYRFWAAEEFTHTCIV